MISDERMLELAVKGLMAERDKIDAEIRELLERGGRQSLPPAPAEVIDVPARRARRGSATAETKLCKECRREKARTEFRKAAYADGRDTVCKECRKAQYRAAHPKPGKGGRSSAPDVPAKSEEPAPGRRRSLQSARAQGHAEKVRQRRAAEADAERRANEAARKRTGYKVDEEGMYVCQHYGCDFEIDSLEAWERHRDLRHAA